MFIYNIICVCIKGLHYSINCVHIIIRVRDGFTVILRDDVMFVIKNYTGTSKYYPQNKHICVNILKPLVSVPKIELLA